MALRGDTRFFGLDLAWADHNPSGACVLDGRGSVLDERTLHSDGDIVDWVVDHLNGPGVIAADIPLQVPNAESARACDRALTSRYAARWAGPHPANRNIFTRRYGRVRGEDIDRQLGKLGFAGPWNHGERTLIEVYPHPGLVEVFGLDRRLAYKKGTLAQRAAGLRRLRSLLDTLAADDPPLRGPRIRIPRRASGRELKAIEDRLDARFCAWTAAMWSRWGSKRVCLFGDPEGGHIAVPLAASGGERE
ncbi:MAG: DUF429 domain-containing protein [Acidimicrobiia bacterium]